MLDVQDGLDKVRLGMVDELSHYVNGAVAVANFVEAGVYGDPCAVWRRSHVAVDQRAAQFRAGGREVSSEALLQTSLSRFDDGAGVVCDEAA